ncbi:DinB family protein [Pontibacter vulgaris]|uniref:DinB family protein n=1 Tax=Pontibacter vulgaris TaxID=2905679 RepID=UPI001FA6BF82|nr:DinB family protein [Pontibacter vulgaris]
MSTIVYSHSQLMNPKLEVKYLRLEQTRNRLLDNLESMDDSLLNTLAPEGKWSINQTIAHLIIVEELTISYIRNKISKEHELQHTSLSNTLKSILLKIALKSGMKFKAPASVATVPDTAYLKSLRHRWDEVRFQLEDLLTEIPPQLLDKCLFKHPYAGPLSITQTLHFLQDHYDHHLRQINHLKQHLLK